MEFHQHRDLGDETDFRTNDAFDSSGCLNLSRAEFERQGTQKASPEFQEVEWPTQKEQEQSFVLDVLGWRGALGR